MEKRNPAIDPRVYELLKGAIDIHVHAAPDVIERKTDCTELVYAAKARQMGGILLKDHVTLTSDRAYVLGKIIPSVKVYGSIVLNYPVGGLNPAAVSGALQMGCDIVYMPTYSARNQFKTWGREKTLHGYPFPRDEEGISILDDSGRLLPAVFEILDLIAEADSVLATGHLSCLEIMKLVKAAVSRKVQRIVITHPSLKLIDLPIDDQLSATKLGAYIEHCYAATLPFLKEKGLTSIEETAHQIREIGVDRCILSTDLGQPSNSHPVEGFGEYINKIIGCGFSDMEVRKMVQKNPRSLLEAQASH